MSPAFTHALIKASIEKGQDLVVGFLRGGNWGTLRIAREDWGTLGKIRGITTPLKNPITIEKTQDLEILWKILCYKIESTWLVVLTKYTLAILGIISSETSFW